MSAAKLRGAVIGWLGHHDGLKPQLTVQEQLTFFARLYRSTADTGAVLHADGFGTPSAAPGDAAYVQPGAGTVAPAPSPAVSVDGDEPPPAGQPTNSYGIGHQIDKGIHRIGGALQQFFTGKRTVDQRFDNEP